ncbi:hypothetical protein H2O64_10650 [Kordia sp. YSTF-M3]|uniref:Uncharacterized protein n=1 Tax=Kordia aestuariivivens TaxID=2759037 RepID=A0ABR7Q9B3_9FLAO|nr:hypothetical protein [Kordia aestuariivivens]MBC8755133.1 hypothetical protein [Kordia aestuariivivens]
MKFEKHTITNFHISFDKKAFHVELFKAEKQGSTLYWIEDDHYEIIWYSSDHHEEKIRDFLEKLHYHFEETLESIYNYVGGIFEIFIRNKENHKLLIVNDLYGVNGSFSLIKNNQLNFFLNFQNFNQLEVPLELDVIGLQAHFAFGYQVKPFPLPYKNITQIEGGKLHTFDSALKHETTALAINFSNNKPSFSLKNGMNATEKLFIGATAGKDSLALLSQVKEGSEYIKAGNFGNIYSADVIQGKEIAVNLDLEYKYTTLCDEDEFEHYARQIAMISGGLATVSYVDMLKFVDEGIPENYSYVMGEAGECVRMFFPEDTNLAKAMHNYLTPKEFLLDSFTNDYLGFLNQYPENISSAVAENYTGNSNAEILVNFYRNGRLPGNFGNRHKLLSVFRDKITPFLHEDFIKQTHNLPHERYENDKIHEQIIYDSNQDLLQFFKNPIKSEISVQGWNERISDDTGNVLYKLLEKHIHALKTVFDMEKVLQLVKKQQKSPNRGVYFLFRIVSMAIFVDSIKNAVAPCEKR